MDEVDGGAARDDGMDRGAAKDGAREQLGMCVGAAPPLEKTAAGGCAAGGERPRATVLVKMCDFF